MFNKLFVGKEKMWATLVVAALSILGADELATLVGANVDLLLAMVTAFTTWVVPNSASISPVGEGVPVDE